MNYIQKTLLFKNKNKLINIIFDPQTAGGFLFIYDGDHKKILKEFKNAQIPCSIIGNINTLKGIRVY